LFFNLFFLTMTIVNSLFLLCVLPFTSLVCGFAPGKNRHVISTISVKGRNVRDVEFLNKDVSAAQQEASDSMGDSGCPSVLKSEGIESIIRDKLDTTERSIDDATSRKGSPQSIDDFPLEIERTPALESKCDNDFAQTIDLTSKRKSYSVQIAQNLSQEAQKNLVEQEKCLKQIDSFIQELREKNELMESKLEEVESTNESLCNENSRLRKQIDHFKKKDEERLTEEKRKKMVANQEKYWEKKVQNGQEKKLTKHVIDEVSYEDQGMIESETEIVETEKASSSNVSKA